MSYTKNIALEEIGKECGIFVECEIEYDVNPGEPRTWEHPGEEPSAELCSVHVLNYTSDTCEVLRDERPDWFAWLDDVVESIVEDNWESHQEDMFEDIARAAEDARW